MQVQSLSGKDPLEKEMATHSSILAGIIEWIEEPYTVYGVAESNRTEHACRQVFSPSKAPTSTALSNLLSLLN